MKTFFVLFPYLVLFLAMLTFVRLVSDRLRTRLAWALVLTAFASKFLVFEVFGGDTFTPQLPERLLWAINWAYSGFMILAVLSTLAWLARLRGRAMLLVAVVSWSVAAVGVYNGVKAPEVKEFSLPSPGLPEELDGYRIALISDLHVSAAATRWRTQAVVDRVNAAGADLVVCTGDIVDGSPERQGSNVEPLRELSAPDGVYFITGNHELYHDYPSWKSLYDKWGLVFLDDACVFPRKGLALAGLGELSYIFSLEGPVNVAAKVFAPATNGEFRVLLQHRPGAARANAAAAKCNLQLSGHTHGGVMPLLDKIVAEHNNGFCRGVYDLGGASRLFVSPGTGQWAGFPVRFFNDPEITVIRLTRQ
ncbi:MAG: metallophosphoesterase [Kiritimatiellae bacterium]|nr:metallophosphoesterase [Kiritimatiellia bacterium]